jgi:hypothetical protein
LAGSALLLFAGCGGAKRAAPPATTPTVRTTTTSTATAPPQTTAPAATAPPAGRSLVVGAVEDGPKYGDGPGKAALARKAGFRALLFGTVWTPPLTRPVPTELAALRGAVHAATLNGIEPIVAVYSFSGVTPLTAEARRQFAAFAASIPRAIPAVRTVSVGNEPNLNLFWLPQFAPDGSDAAAPAYGALLAETYDALKAVSPEITVIGGSLGAHGSDDPSAARQTHSPTRFIEDLGAWYRASGRTRPLLDIFSIHPYPESSSVPPDLAHPGSTSIGIADYEKLVGLLRRAFGEVPPIAYGEYGIQTEIPAAKASRYTGAEQPSIRAVDEATQARFYVQAIRLAACQPKVRLLLFFHVFDEARLERLQTGLYYADETPKSSLRPVADAPLTCSS